MDIHDIVMEVQDKLDKGYQSAEDLRERLTPVGNMNNDQRGYIAILSVLAGFELGPEDTVDLRLNGHNIPISAFTNRFNLAISEAIKLDHKEENIELISLHSALIGMLEEYDSNNLPNG